MLSLGNALALAKHDMGLVGLCCEDSYLAKVITLSGRDIRHGQS